MSIYTVHEPPLRAGVTASDAERYVFVRDGFSFRAFLFGPLWMLWHRMWLVLTGYILVSAVIETLVAASGASAFAVGTIGVLISLLVGLEAGTLRRFTLRRHGWRNVGIVSGDGLEAAERRFFESWVRHAAQPGAPGASAPATPAASPPPSPRMPQPPEVIGLFPEPGARR
jgi:Protein of unknown function (DUF2628)